MNSSAVIAVLLATVAQFILGAIWYTPLFGKLWGQIHGFDKLPKAKQKEMMSQMLPLLAGQFAVTLITSIVLVILHSTFPNYSLPMLAAYIWIGFVTPAQTSAILFGGTPAKWIITKIAIMAGGSLICLLAGATVVSYFI